MNLLCVLVQVDLLESLPPFLSQPDVLRLAATCRLLRLTLGGSQLVWRSLSLRQRRTRDNEGAGPDFLMRDYGEYQAGLSTLTLSVHSSDDMFL